jgi:sporulation protein YlmC with PRC-barrel domain
MIRASGLYGRGVVDLDTAERVGCVDEIIVDPYGPGIAGYVVSCERTLFGKRKRVIVSMDAIHAIGPDALTMRSVGTPDYQTAHLDALPRLSELTGRRMISFGGRLLGSIEDALIDEGDGRIIGYPLERPGPGTWLEPLIGLGWRVERPDYVRADAALRIGARLIVVPDDAIASGSDFEEATTDDLPGVDGSGSVPWPSGSRLEEDRPTATNAAAEWASQATTPFSTDGLAVTDDGLGLQPSAEADRDEHSPPAVDSEQDTGQLPAADLARGRTRRRPQAEKLR